MESRRRSSRARPGSRRSAEQRSAGRLVSQATDSRVAVGVIRRPWGFDGSVAVAQFSDDPDRFAPGDQVFIDGAGFSVEKVQTTGNSTVLKLTSVDTEDQANALRGHTIEMDAAALPSQPAGVYYHYQIIGARVVTVGGEELGTVREILETGSNDVYVVRAEPRPGQKAAPEILVPALKNVVVNVDTEHGVIEVDLPEGLR